MRTSFSGSKKKGREGKRDGKKKVKIERILIKVNGLLKGFRRKESKKILMGDFVWSTWGRELPQGWEVESIRFFS